MSDFWEYDPAVNSWTQKTDFGGGKREGAFGFALNGKGYVGTGYKSQIWKDFWQFTPDCKIPQSLTTTNIKATSAKVNWTIEPTAQSYSVRYRKTGTVPWTKITATTNFKKLTSLTPNTQYDWSVKSVCDAVNNISSNWSATQNFTTKPLRLGEEGGEVTLDVFPNPVASSATVSFISSQNSHVALELFDPTGRKIKTLFDEIVEAGNHEIDFNRGQLSAGMYYLQVTMYEETLIVRVMID